MNLLWAAKPCKDASYVRACYVKTNVEAANADKKPFTVCWCSSRVDIRVLLINLHRHSSNRNIMQLYCQQHLGSRKAFPWLRGMMVVVMMMIISDDMVIDGICLYYSLIGPLLRDNMRHKCIPSLTVVCDACDRIGASNGWNCITSAVVPSVSLTSPRDESRQTAPKFSMTLAEIYIKLLVHLGLAFLDGNSSSPGDETPTSDREKPTSKKSSGVGSLATKEVATKESLCTKALSKAWSLACETGSNDLIRDVLKTKISVCRKFSGDAYSRIKADLTAGAVSKDVTLKAYYVAFGVACGLVNTDVLSNADVMSVCNASENSTNPYVMLISVLTIRAVAQCASECAYIALNNGEIGPSKNMAIKFAASKNPEARLRGVLSV